MFSLNQIKFNTALVTYNKVLDSIGSYFFSIFMFFS
jgi:hypothetical protein